MGSPLIAACGNDCSKCPKYTSKSLNELQKAAELWYKLGWSDKITSPEETKCSGCSPSRKLCGIVNCLNEHHLQKCIQCSELPCEKINALIQSNKETKNKCEGLCSDSEYEVLHKAFFEKEANLRKLGIGRK